MWRVARIVSCLVLIAVTPLRAGEIDAVRESVFSAASSDQDSATSSTRSRTRHFDDDNESFIGELLGQVFGPVILQTALAPISLPIILTEDDYTQRAMIVPKPYHDQPFTLRWEADSEEPLPQVFGRLQVDYATNFDGLSQAGVQLLLELPSRFGLDSSWLSWREDEWPYDDTLELGDVNFVYRFAQSDQLQFRAGLGLNWGAGNSAGEVGFNFTYGLDYYPRKPWVISTNFDLGTLGHAGLFHNQTTVGAIVRSCEIFTGLDYRRIGDGELSGWITGIRWRF